jgi:hypothetical protein
MNRFTWSLWYGPIYDDLQAYEKQNVGNNARKKKSPLVSHVFCLHGFLYGYIINKLQQQQHQRQKIIPYEMISLHVIENWQEGRRKLDVAEQEGEKR